MPTPTFPGFVSGHPGYSAAAADVLCYFFLSERATLEAKADEAAMSRLYTGIHLRATTSTAANSARWSARAVVDRIKRDGADL